MDRRWKCLNSNPIWGGTSAASSETLWGKSGTGNRLWVIYISYRNLVRKITFLISKLCLGYLICVLKFPKNPIWKLNVCKKKSLSNMLIDISKKYYLKINLYFSHKKPIICTHIPMNLILYLIYLVYIMLKGYIILYGLWLVVCNLFIIYLGYLKYIT